MKSYETFFKNKRITLMGLGLLGRGVGDAQFLADLGAELIITDLKDAEQLAASLEQLKQFSNITYRLGEHNLEDFKERDMILKAAGVPLNSIYIQEAKKNGIPVRMSADLFAEFGGVPIVGVTGTRGKSTTTHLISHMLKLAGKKVLLGGNVQGVSTLALLAHVEPDSIGVLELDSWQLQGFGEARLSPQVAVFTTFMPDHMNYYKNDMATYFADKANIFLYQSADDTLIVGEQMVPFVAQYGFKNKIVAHTVVAGTKDISRDWKLQIVGEHNRMNAGIAAAAARELGLDESVIKKAVESFEGVPGRLQLIRELNGVKIYNDTTATVPDATVAALQALGKEGDKKTILIMGGADKMLDMSALVEAIPKFCKKVFMLAGTGTTRIQGEVADAVVCALLAEAVQKAWDAAEVGDTIVLSPAFASFGMFKNEYDRGDQFNALVASLVA